jgi:hypothetical protein
MSKITCPKHPHAPNYHFLSLECTTSTKQTAFVWHNLDGHNPKSKQSHGAFFLDGNKTEQTTNQDHKIPAATGTIIVTSTQSKQS